MIPRFIIKTISSNNLIDFFSNEYKPNFDLPKLKDIFDTTIELCYDNEDELSTNVIHACFDIEQQRYCGFINIGTSTIIDDLVSLNVEFLFLEKDYRGKVFKELDNIKLSRFLLIEYLATKLGVSVKDNFAINMISITPINEKVRKSYENLNFVTIDGSGSKKEEDWMICYI